MTRISAAALATLAATQAAALTCVPADPITTFRMAQEAPESYVVLYGRLDFDSGAMRDGTDIVSPGAAETPLEPVPARFGGFALTPEGFTRPVQGQVSLQPICFSQWCGSIGPGDDWLLFAQSTTAGTFQVGINPCGVWAFEGVSLVTLDVRAGCLRGENCG